MCQFGMVCRILTRFIDPHAHINVARTRKNAVGCTKSGMAESQKETEFGTETRNASGKYHRRVDQRVRFWPQPPVTKYVCFSSSTALTCRPSSQLRAEARGLGLVINFTLSARSGGEEERK